MRNEAWEQAATRAVVYDENLTEDEREKLATWFFVLQAAQARGDLKMPGGEAEVQPRRARRSARRLISARTRQFVWDRDDGVCGLCDEPADPTYWHLDHVVPFSRGGSDDVENLRVSHPRCNVARGNRT